MSQMGADEKLEMAGCALLCEIGVICGFEL